jgi:hypothetical protein
VKVALYDEAGMVVRVLISTRKGLLFPQFYVLIHISDAVINVTDLATEVSDCRLLYVAIVLAIVRNYERIISVLMFFLCNM